MPINVTVLCLTEGRRLILEAIDDPDQRHHSAAYVYAALTLLCNLLKSQADLNHLWHGRRAQIRMRTELMITIYDKALKRKDLSGAIDTGKMDVTGDSARKGSAIDFSKGRTCGLVVFGTRMCSLTLFKATTAKRNEEPKAGADIGKIINLMSGDASTVGAACPTIAVLLNSRTN